MPGSAAEPAMKINTIGSVLIQALAIFFAAPTVSAQTSADSTRQLAAMRTDLEHIKADLDLVKSQLGQVLRVLNNRPSTQARTVTTRSVRASVADAPSFGRPDAPVTIVEFSDYQCPFCQRFFATTLPALAKDYIEAGKVRYVFRDFPLDQLHPRARKAAEAAHCAGEQGKYWEMHDTLFRNQAALEVPQLGEYARSLGLDGPTFDVCLSSGRNSMIVSRGVTDGIAAGLQGTPSFVIGRTKKGDFVEGTSIRGAQTIETFRQVIEQMLSNADQEGHGSLGAAATKTETLLKRSNNQNPEVR
jgi:protein-disulfide isomerase